MLVYVVAFADLDLRIVGFIDTQTPLGLWTPTPLYLLPLTIMTSVGSVTRQIAAMEISNKKPTPAGGSSIRAPSTKQPAPPNPSVTKLLTKFAAPNPFTNASNKPANPSSLRNPTHANQPSTSSRPGHAAQPSIDIGKYDGGLELDNEKRGERVYGEAAEDLALDSSVSKCVTHISFSEKCSCKL